MTHDMRGQMYYAIGNANQAIADLSKVKDGDVEAVKAEALLCRAWSMFRLATAFCMAYDDSKADKYLGLPYPKEPNRSIDTRGTLRELYENINADIEAALPHVSESYMTVPKYHFNLKAAYAFAARFNLYYQKWDKAAEYASKALGSQPASLLRTVYRYKTLGGRSAIHDAYINSSENANFMLQTAVSSAGAPLSMEDISVLIQVTMLFLMNSTGQRCHGEQALVITRFMSRTYSMVIASRLLTPVCLMSLSILMLQGVEDIFVLLMLCSQLTKHYLFALKRKST